MKENYLWFRRHWTGLLIKIYGVFIVFATTAPFKISRDFHTYVKNLNDVVWIPLHHMSRGDFVANIIFFIPFGMLLAARQIFRNYRFFTRRDWWEIFLKGLLMSGFVEFLQLFTYDRSTSVNDIISNVLGALLGAWGMALLYRYFHGTIKDGLRRLFYRKPDVIVFFAWCGFIALAELAPFTFWISFTSVKRALILLRLDPWHLSGIVAEFFQLTFYFAVAGYFGARALYRHFREVRRQKFYLIAGLGLFAVALELLQLTLADRRHSVLDPLICLLGAAIGMICFSIQKRQLKPGRETLPLDGGRAAIWQKMDHQVFLLAGIVYVILLLRMALAPGAAGGNLAANLRHFWEPYRWLWHTNRLEALEELIKYAVLFVPAGFLGKFWQNRLTGNTKLAWSRWAGTFLVVLFFLSRLILDGSDIHWSKFLVSLGGFWLGGFFYSLYVFIQVEM